MAIYKFQSGVLSRAKGGNSLAAAAYRSAENLEDKRLGVTHFYSNRKEDVLYKAITLPEALADMALSRAELWNGVELHETRKNAQVARDWMGALPHELSLEQNIGLAQRMASHLSERYQTAVDFAVHHAPKKGDDRNIHVHYLHPTREMTVDGFGAKLRQLVTWRTGKEEYRHLRETWGRFVNEALEAAGSRERIDHRSYKAQGINRKPAPHMGKLATAREREGIRTQLGDDVRAIEFENRQLETAAFEPLSEQERARIQQVEAYGQTWEQEQDLEQGAEVGHAGYER